jgi:hypothetical protein
MEHYKNLSLEDIIYEYNGETLVEEWRNVVGFEGLYMVSNLGRIKSLSRQIKKANYDVIYKDKILKASLDKDGYCKVVLSNDKNKKHKRVHILVSESFIANIENKLQVNHKKGIKTDNRDTELEWSTSSENNKHAYKIELRKPPQLGKFGKLHGSSKPIIQYDLNDNFIKEWECARSVKIENLKIIPSLISACCLNKNKTHLGFKWKFKNNVIN